MKQVGLLFTHVIRNQVLWKRQGHLQKIKLATPDITKTDNKNKLYLQELASKNIVEVLESYASLHLFHSDSPKKKRTSSTHNTPRMTQIERFIPTHDFERIFWRPIKEKRMVSVMYYRK